MWTGSAFVVHVAGWEGIICGLSAIYLAMAEVLHESLGKKLLKY
jgi:succinate-acetate transporter protein